MALTNYRDISRRGSDTRAGFQFEFSCARCSRTWKSPFKPYRKGQLAGLIYRLSHYIGGRGYAFNATSGIASVGENRAQQQALDEALEEAEQHYAECHGCQKIVCEKCWDAGEQMCSQCTTHEPGDGTHVGAASGGERGGAESAAVGAAQRCPNCGSGLGGGRFCAECGFDMAATHKTCPGCGTLCLRSARFCTDCGHGF